MASVNKVILVGNLGRDPETKYMPDGAAVTNVSVATTSQCKDKASGEKREETEWHRVAFFGKLAEIAGEYLRKGSQAYIEGRLKTRKWKDKDGVERYSTEIMADQLVMLGKPQNVNSDPAPENESKHKGPETPQPKPGGIDDMDSDLPF